MENTIDLLWAASLDYVAEEQTNNWAVLAVSAIDYAYYNNHPNWLDQVRDDYEFLYELQRAVNTWNLQASGTSLSETSDLEELGGLDVVWDYISESTDRIHSAIGCMLGRTIVVARSAFHRHLVSQFLGDIFIYLREPEKIVAEIVRDLKAARSQADRNGEKLIVVAHSMGGNIVYDILTHFQSNLDIDVLVTVGSQVAFFEELKLFRASDSAVSINAAVNRVSMPRNVHHWINVFDLNDIFLFITKKVFEGVHDFEYLTGRGVISAHTTYFERPSFHRRLNEQIQCAYK